MDEVAHRALMRAYADAGNRSAALEQFWSLREELGRSDLKPTPETRLPTTTSRARQSPPRRLDTRGPGR
jgi:DNA-binding SARP family transcriptional activator